MQVVAFFDVDGTLWSEKSVLTFYRFFLESTRPGEADGLWARFLAEVASQQAAGTGRERLNAWFYATCFEGLEVRAVDEVARRWYAERAGRPGFFLEPVLGRARAHRDAGHEIVLVSGSFREVVRPLAELVGARHAILAPLEERGGVYTGRLTGPPAIGPGKASAVAAYLEARGADARACYGYGDDETDVPFLELLGRPSLVLGEGAPLASLARERGWGVVAASGPASEGAARRAS